MKTKRNYLLEFIVALIPMVIIAIFYSQLPDQMPMNWGISGEVNRYGAKSSIWLLASIPIVLTLIFMALPKIDPRKENYKKFNSQYNMFILMFNTFFALIIGVVVMESINPGTMNIGRIIPIMVGLLFIFLGNIMPKFKSNFFMGIKTPWTLSSEEVWNKTHRFAGVLWVIGGLLIALSAFVLNPSVNFFILIGTAAVIGIAPIVMSYVWYQK